MEHSAHAVPGAYGRSISDVKSAKNNLYFRRPLPVNAQYKDILERGWDGRMALGRRTGAERRLLAAHLSTSTRYVQHGPLNIYISIKKPRRVWSKLGVGNGAQILQRYMKKAE